MTLKQSKIVKSLFIGVLLLIAGLLGGIVLYYGTIFSMGSIYDLESQLNKKKIHELRKNRNNVHLKHAHQNGIAPLPDRNEFELRKDDHLQKQQLTRLASNKFVYLSFLNNSLPFLTEDTYQLANDIGRLFQQRLQNEGVSGNYRIVITSCLRTKADQKVLMNSNNVNAVPKSAHYYGTTFDITYKRVVSMPVFAEEALTHVVGNRSAKTITKWFFNHYSTNIKGILGDVLIGLQKQGKCIALYEKAEPCFHVTVK